MGKRIIQQRRGKGSLTYRVRKKAFIYRIGYPNISREAEIIKLIHSRAHTAPIAKLRILNKEAKESIFYVPAFEGAARYAFERANELGGNPLVISGLMDEENWTVRHTYELANGEFFVVNGVWLPKKGLDWHQLNPYGKGLSKEFFDEFDPKKLLTK